MFLNSLNPGFRPTARTVDKRANSLIQILRWKSLRSSVDACLTEEGFWEYLQQLRRTQAPATRASASASAIRFAIHVLGVMPSQPILSRSCIGLIEQECQSGLSFDCGRVCVRHLKTSAHANLASQILDLVRPLHHAGFVQKHMSRV